MVAEIFKFVAREHMSDDECRQTEMIYSSPNRTFKTTTAVTSLLEIR
jgi:hypothetical protein